MFVGPAVSKLCRIVFIIIISERNTPAESQRKRYEMHNECSRLQEGVPARVMRIDETAR